MLKGTINHNLLFLTLLIYCVVLTTLILLMGVLNTPIADDYSYFADARREGNIAAFSAHYFMDINGRFTQYSIAALGYYAFGVDIVRIAPFVLFALLGASYSYLLLQFRLGIASYWYVLLGYCIAGISIFVNPSIFDSFLWYTSSTVYILALSVLVFNLALIFKLWHSSPSIRLIVITSLSIFLGQFINEPMSLLTILLTAGITLLALYRKKNFRSIMASAVICAASIIGFGILYLSPGNMKRLTAKELDTTILEALWKTLSDYQVLLNDLLTYRLVFVVFLSLILIMTARKYLLNNYRVIVVLGLVLCVIVPLIAPFISNYTVGVTPWRNFTISYASFFMGLPIIIATILSHKFRNIFSQKHFYVTLLFATVAIATTAATLHQSISIIRAEALRSSAVAHRNHQVFTQLSTDNNPSVLFVTAAPILLERTEANDLNYTEVQSTDWFTRGYKEFFNIPKDTEIKILPQPSTYCTNRATAEMLNAKRCSQTKSLD